MMSEIEKTTTSVPARANGSVPSNGSNGHGAYEPIGGADDVGRTLDGILKGTSDTRIEGSRSAGQSEGVKLDATTRMVNGFMGYLTNVLGRQPDQMSQHDVQSMFNMLRTMEGLKPGTKRYSQN